MAVKPNAEGLALGIGLVTFGTGWVALQLRDAGVALSAAAMRDAVRRFQTLGAGEPLPNTVARVWRFQARQCVAFRARRYRWMVSMGRAVRRAALSGTGVRG